MKKYLAIILTFVICFTSYSANYSVYVVLPSEVDISDSNIDIGNDDYNSDATIGIYAMDSDGPLSSSDIEVEKVETSYSGDDYQTIKIILPYESDSLKENEQVKLAVGYKNPLSSESQYVFMTSENPVALETLENHLDYDTPLKVISTSTYSSYNDFPGYEVGNDVKLFAFPINDTTENISQEFGLPDVDFEIADGKIVVNEPFSAKVQILASQFTSSGIAAAVKLNGSKVSDWTSDLEDEVSYKYKDWDGSSIVYAKKWSSSTRSYYTNSITEYRNGKYNLIKPLTHEIKSGEKGDIITVVSRYSNSSIRDSGDSDDIITTNYDNEGNPISYEYGSIFVKRNGDTVRNLSGYSGQDDVVDLAGDVLVEEEDENGVTKYKVSIGPNDVLLLFEHGGTFTEDPTKTNGSYLDMQDLVVLITFDTEETSEHIMTFIFDEGTEVSDSVSMKSVSENSKKQRISQVSMSLTETDSDEKFNIKAISNTFQDSDDYVTSDDDSDGNDSSGDSDSDVSDGGDSSDDGDSDLSDGGGSSGDGDSDLSDGGDSSDDDDSDDGDSDDDDSDDGDSDDDDSDDGDSDDGDSDDDDSDDDDSDDDDSDDDDSDDDDSNNSDNDDRPSNWWDDWWDNRGNNWGNRW